MSNLYESLRKKIGDSNELLKILYPAAIRPFTDFYSDGVCAACIKVFQAQVAESLELSVDFEPVPYHNPIFLGFITLVVERGGRFFLKTTAICLKSKGDPIKSRSTDSILNSCA